MSNHIHNLDEGILEYFEFIIKGYNYRFRYPNTEEVMAMSKMKDEGTVNNQTIYQFITKVDENSPDFEQISKQITIPQWKMFNAMIFTELGLDKEQIKTNERNQGQTNT